jgi:hypothetical protein
MRVACASLLSEARGACVVSSIVACAVAGNAAPMASDPKADLALCIKESRARLGSFSVEYETVEIGNGDVVPQRTWHDRIHVAADGGVRVETAWTDAVTVPGRTLGGTRVMAQEGGRMLALDANALLGMLSSDCDAIGFYGRVPIAFHVHRWYPGVGEAGCDVRGDLLRFLESEHVAIADSSADVDGVPCIRLDQRVTLESGISVLQASVWLDPAHGHLPRLQRTFEAGNVYTELRVQEFAQAPGGGWLVAKATRSIPIISPEEANGWSGGATGAVQHLSVACDADGAPATQASAGAADLLRVPQGSTLKDLDTGETWIASRGDTGPNERSRGSLAACRLEPERRSAGPESVRGVAIASFAACGLLAVVGLRSLHRERSRMRTDGAPVRFRSRRSEMKSRDTSR